MIDNKIDKDKECCGRNIREDERKERDKERREMKG